MNATATDLVTCPKCSGAARAFANFAHVNGGRCLLCDGDLEVSLAAASRWLAAQVRQDLPRGTGESSAVYHGHREPTATKRIELCGREVTIERWPDGAFSILTIDPEAGWLRSGFGVDERGRVFVTAVCNGHAHDLGGKPYGLVCGSDEDRQTDIAARQTIRRALQAAYTGGAR
jgi:hypothetical protein